MKAEENYTVIAIGLAIVIVFLICLSQQSDFNSRPKREFNTTTHCNDNNLTVEPLCGSFGSVKTDSVKTDKLNFPMWCPLIEDKPRGWGLKK